MQKLIGEDYYDQDSDGDGKPQFDKEDFDEDVNGRTFARIYLTYGFFI